MLPSGFEHRYPASFASKSGHRFAEIVSHAPLAPLSSWYSDYFVTAYQEPPARHSSGIPCRERSVNNFVGDRPFIRTKTT
jgi:hypothetical protein